MDGGILEVLTLVGGGLQIASQASMANAKRAALNQQMKETQVASNDRALQKTRKVLQVLGAQQATQAASGFSASSPTFGAITTDTIDEYSKDMQLNKLNEKLTLNSLENKKESTTLEEIAGVGGTLASFGRLYSNTRIPSYNSKSKNPVYKV